MRTHETRDIQPKLGAADLKRYTKLASTGTRPIALSPHEPGTVYIGAQFLFRSRDHGQTWDRISPDLTTNDPREAEAGTIGRHHRRQLGRGNAHHDLLHQRIAPAGGTHLGGDRRRQRATHPRRRQALGQRRGQRAGDPQERLGELGAGEPFRCRAPPTWRSIGTPSATWRPTSTRPRTSARPGGRWPHLPMRRACAATRTSSRRMPSTRSCSFSVPSSDSGSRSTAARTGRSSRAVTSRRSRCAISPCSRVTMIWCSRPTAAASGSSTTSRRCGI